ncbi:hypothetical protein [Rhodospira trueperi]|uniref:Uncharacterized protein n=1 Tax=Rhodospira trueperi TaxID=69960 RepID=A0A1G6XTA3_9PROT|nr:hypothetical protein [Rhodospira trueperi]SDD81252.1 hypothetical protein SAMN05421720_101619 [Rhodospira trueperi]
MPDKSLSDIDFTDFLQAMLNPAFGSITKKEMEIRIFACLYKQGYFGRLPSNFAIASTLNIPDATVERLIYEMDLRDITEDAQAWAHGVMQESLRVIALQLDARTSTVKMNIPRKALRELIFDIAQREAEVADQSHRASIVTLNLDGFAKVMETLLSRDEIAKLHETMRRVDEVVPGPDTSLRGLTKTFLHALAEDAGGRVLDLPKLFLPGGMADLAKDSVEDAVGILKRVFAR